MLSISDSAVEHYAVLRILLCLFTLVTNLIADTKNAKHI